MVEHHREHGDGLADRLFLAAVGVELGDHVGDRLRVERVGRGRAEPREDAAECHVVGLHRPLCDVDPGRLPASRQRAHPDDVHARAREFQVRDAARG